jgi:hypothetical protein
MEMLDETCGMVVDGENLDSLEKEILHVCMNSPFSKENCLKKAQEFNMNKKFKEYIKLYESINIS